jgi:ABC-type glutathione transport system ATPase component
MSPLLSIRISADYHGRRDVLREASFEMQAGEILGLAGQSGAGKSTIALAVLKLLESKGGAARGSVLFRGRELLACSEREMRRIRGREIALVPQSPIAALNPVLRLGTQLAEAWRVHAGFSTGDWKPRVRPLLESVSLPGDAAFLRRYPRELSVGLAQRVLIAMALLHQPSLLIADEPTSALDLITQSEILALFARLNRELGIGILYISHDLLSMAALCHRMAILHAGEIVETGAAEQVFRSPAHPYTARLIAALPRLEWPCGAGAFACQPRVAYSPLTNYNHVGQALSPANLERPTRR